MKRLFIALLMLPLGHAAAWAQGNAPFVPPNPADTAPASALDDMPNKVISNGIVSAKVYLPDEFGFYRGASPRSLCAQRPDAR